MWLSRRKAAELNQISRSSLIQLCFNHNWTSSWFITAIVGFAGNIDIDTLVSFLSEVSTCAFSIKVLQLCSWILVLNTEYKFSYLPHSTEIPRHQSYSSTACQITVRDQRSHVLTWWSTVEAKAAASVKTITINTYWTYACTEKWQCQ
jgi:hypothetical protein